MIVRTRRIVVASWTHLSHRVGPVERLVEGVWTSGPVPVCAAHVAVTALVGGSTRIRRG